MDTVEKSKIVKILIRISARNGQNRQNFMLSAPKKDYSLLRENSRFRQILKHFSFPLYPLSCLTASTSNLSLPSQKLSYVQPQFWTGLVTFIQPPLHTIAFKTGSHVHSYHNELNCVMEFETFYSDIQNFSPQCPLLAITSQSRSLVKCDLCASSSFFVPSKASCKILFSFDITISMVNIVPNTTFTIFSQSLKFFIFGLDPGRPVFVKAYGVFTSIISIWMPVVSS